MSCRRKTGVVGVVVGCVVDSCSGIVGRCSADVCDSIANILVLVSKVAGPLGGVEWSGGDGVEWSDGDGVGSVFFLFVFLMVVVCLVAWCDLL